MSSNFSIAAWTLSLKEEMIARQRARPPYTARYPCMSSYTFWRWELGILHPRNPCLLHTELCALCALPLPRCSPVYRKCPAAGKIVDKVAVIPLLHCSHWERGERTRLCHIFWVITLTSLVVMVSPWHLCMQWHLYMQWQPQRPLVPGLTHFWSRNCSRTKQSRWSTILK